MTKNFMSEYEEDKEKDREELTLQINKLAEQDATPAIGDLLEDFLKQRELPFSQSGETIGLNYNIDEYMVELPCGKILNYGIGGRESTYIEQVRLLTPEQAEIKQKVMNITYEFNMRAAEAVAGSDVQKRKDILSGVRQLQDQMELIGDWVKEHLDKEPPKEKPQDPNRRPKD